MKTEQLERVERELKTFTSGRMNKMPDKDEPSTAGQDLQLFLSGGPLIYRGNPEDLKRSVVDSTKFKE